MTGWIKTHRKITDWQWYTDVPVKVLFSHLMLVANYEDAMWRGQLVKRGQRVTSAENLALETGLSVQQVRTAIKKLKSTNEIAVQTTSKYTVITITSYEAYQSEDEYSNKQITNEQQTNNKPSTTNKEEQEIKKNKNISLSPAREGKTYSAEFLEFYELYPPNAGSKAKAYESWQKAINSGVEHERISGRAKEYRDYVASSGDLTAHAATWLNQRRWETDYAGLYAARGHSNQVRGSVSGQASTGTRQSKTDIVDAATERVLAKFGAGRGEAQTPNGHAGQGRIETGGGIAQAVLPES